MPESSYTSHNGAGVLNQPLLSADGLRPHPGGTRALKLLAHPSQGQREALQAREWPQGKNVGAGSGKLGQRHRNTKGL